jgi:hypothetical protein
MRSPPQHWKDSQDGAAKPFSNNTMHTTVCCVLLTIKLLVEGETKLDPSWLDGFSQIAEWVWMIQRVP